MVSVRVLDIQTCLNCISSVLVRKDLFMVVLITLVILGMSTREIICTTSLEIFPECVMTKQAECILYVA